MISLSMASLASAESEEGDMMLLYVLCQRGRGASTGALCAVNLPARPIWRCSMVQRKECSEQRPACGPLPGIAVELSPGRSSARAHVGASEQSWHPRSTTDY